MGPRRLWHRRWRDLAAGAILLVRTFGSSVANAEPGAAKTSEPYRMIWSSSAECGDGSRFLRELEQRTTLLRPARNGEHAITLIVELFGSPGGVRGQLTVRKPDGDLTVREVPGRQCQEVESALALIVALMVDPLASSAGQAGARAARTTPLQTIAPAAQNWSLRVEQHATVRTAVAPGLAWGQTYPLMLTHEGGGIRPSFGLSGNFARGTSSQPQGAAEFEWSAVELSLCPVGFQPAFRWDLRACATFQAGRLRGAGFETRNPAQKSILWSAVGLALEGRVNLIGPLWLALEGGLELPFSRDRFFLEPGSTLHQVPSAGLSAGAGLGLRFF